MPDDQGRNICESRPLDRRIDGCTENMINGTAVLDWVPTDYKNLCDSVIGEHTGTISEMYHLSYFLLGTVGSLAAFLSGWMVAILLETWEK